MPCQHHASYFPVGEAVRGWLSLVGSLHLSAAELELLRSFWQHQVRYLVIGGHAVQHYGYLRVAKDLDLFVDREGDNPANVIAALGAVGISDLRLTEDQLSKDKQQIHIGAPHYVELLTTIEAVEFHEAFDTRSIVRDSALEIPVISYDLLIKTKRALGRPEDLTDISELEKTQS